jgi:hypothetical protein
LNKPDIEDSIQKCVKFKSLNRVFCDIPNKQRIKNSLFVIWGFNSPESSTVKKNLEDQIKEIDRTLQPDLIVVPNKLVGRSGSLLELTTIGRAGSKFREELILKHGNDLGYLLPDQVVMYELLENSLFIWYVWLDSWLRNAGSRFTDPIEYLRSSTMPVGRIVN